MASDTKEKKTKGNTNKTKTTTTANTKKTANTATAKKTTTKKTTKTNTTDNTKPTKGSTAKTTKPVTAKSVEKKAANTNNNTEKKSVKTSTAKKTTSTKKKTTTTSPKKKTQPMEEKYQKTTIEVVEELHLGEEPIVEDKYLEIRSVPEITNSTKSILGNELPSGQTELARSERQKYYMKDAFLFAIIIPILDLFAMLFIDAYQPLLATDDMMINYIVTLLIDFTLIFVLTYLIDYIFGEDSARKNRK